MLLNHKLSGDYMYYVLFRKKIFFFSFCFIFTKWVQEAQLHPLFNVTHLCTCRKLKIHEKLHKEKEHRANKPKLKPHNSLKFNFDLRFSNCSGTEALTQTFLAETFSPFEKCF